MLGEIIYEAKGNVTGMRVLDVQRGIPKIESTISQNGDLRGTKITVMVTYWSIPRTSEEEGGKTVLYAEGQGFLMAKQSNETVTWTGQGIAHLIGDKRTDRGSVFFSTLSKGKLAFLNNTVGIFEYEANLGNGTVEGKVWEWK